jgi:class 3 adenylate cyclase
MAEHGSRVLIADDNKVNRLLLARSVEQLGHRVSLAENGRMALQMLRTEPFDLLLLDIEMPELDGFAVLEQLKADPRLRDVRIIVTSSVEGLDSIVRCIDLGAEDYLRKPVNQVLLKARIGACLERKRLRDQQKAIVRRFVTSEVADELLQSGFALGGKRLCVSALIADIRGFTALVESEGPEETIDLLNTYHTLMFEAIGSHRGVINQIVGDGLVAVFGAPLPLEDCAGRAVAAGLEMLELIEQFNLERSAMNKSAIRIGIGVATGDVVAGYIGTQQRATYTCIGDTVNLAARLEAHTKAAGHSLLIDGATQRAVGGSVPIQSLGEVPFKGKAAAVEIFAVMAGKPH